MSRIEQVYRALRFRFQAMNTSVEVQLCADREQAEHAASLVKTGLKRRSSASAAL